MTQQQILVAPSFLTMKLDLITIRIGEEPQAVDFPVYRELLTAVSPYFKGAFDGKFREADERRIALPDVTEQTFRIFLQWAHTQLGASGTATVPKMSVLLGETGVAQAASQDDDSDSSSDVRAFDEKGFNPFNVRLTDLGADDLCGKTWAAHSKAYYLSAINLFIFADKYSVHQLRDDIMTALLGQFHAWDECYLSPSEDIEDIIKMVYDTLPTSATLLHFMATCIGLFWLPAEQADDDCAARLRQLYKWQPDFALEVSVVEAKLFRGWIIMDENYRKVIVNDEFRNSCLFHEHLVRDQEACRKRIENHPWVFANIINACIKDGIAMVEEQQDQDTDESVPDGSAQEKDL